MPLVETPNPLPYLGPEAVAGTVDWTNTRKVHDWRNHVPSNVQEIWSTFTEAQRTALVQWADGLASNEEWE